MADRLKDLYAVDEKIRVALLGHPPEDRGDLLLLQSKVRAEIRHLVIRQLINS